MAIRLQHDFQIWADIPIVYGPTNYKEKREDCYRRAKLIDGYIEFVNDDRYCIVTKQLN